MKSRIQPIRFTGTGSWPVAHWDTSGLLVWLLNSGASLNKQVAQTLNASIAKIYIQFPGWELGGHMKNRCIFGLLMDPGLVKNSLWDEGEMILPGSERCLLWITARAVVPAMLCNPGSLRSVTWELWITFSLAKRKTNSFCCMWQALPCSPSWGFCPNYCLWQTTAMFTSLLAQMFVHGAVDVIPGT